MNNKTLFLSVNILLIVATPTAAQFNDVMKKKTYAKVYSQGEYEAKPLFTENAAEGPEDVVKDSREKKVEGTDSVRPMRPLFCHPLEGGKLEVTSPFGYRDDPFNGNRKFHKGTDFRTRTENVYAMMPGRIKKIGYDKRLGNYIRIEHGDWEVTYGHLYTVRGHKGDYVDAGHSVGISGSTGRSTGEHLHVSVEYKGKHIDPYPFIVYVTEQAKLSHNPGEREVQRDEPTPNGREKAKREVVALVDPQGKEAAVMQEER